MQNKYSNVAMSTNNFCELRNSASQGSLEPEIECAMIGAAVSIFARIFARFPREKFVCALLPSLVVGIEPAIPLPCPSDDKK